MFSVINRILNTNCVIQRGFFFTILFGTLVCKPKIIKRFSNFFSELLILRPFITLEWAAKGLSPVFVLDFISLKTYWLYSNPAFWKFLLCWATACQTGEHLPQPYPSDLSLNIKTQVFHSRLQKSYSTLGFASDIFVLRMNPNPEMVRREDNIYWHLLCARYTLNLYLY